MMVGGQRICIASQPPGLHREADTYTLSLRSRPLTCSGPVPYDPGGVSVVQG